MITYVKGDLFESPAHVLVNTVNTVGVMGKGIAKKFKKIYPEMFKQYQQLYEENKLTIGKLWIYRTSNKWILNFPTKTTWRKPSELEYIEKGLQTFVNNYSEYGITSIAFPPLGCGNGELDWEKQVKPVMEKYLKKLGIDIFIYLYRQEDFKPEHKNIKEMKKWLYSEPENLSFFEVWNDLSKIVGEGIELETLDSGTKFLAKINNKGDSEEKNIIFSFNDKNITVYFEDIYELWGQIRNHGFSMKRIMPESLQEVGEQIFTLFSKLEYCKPVEINLEDNNKYETGLQLYPRASERKSYQIKMSI